MSTHEDAMQSAVFALFDDIIIRMRKLERLSKEQEMAAIETENIKLREALTTLTTQTNITTDERIVIASTALKT